MYNQILNGIKFQNNIADDKQLSSYLKSIQSDVKKLRSCYRSTTVSVDYAASNVQDAYMLTYFPHYTHVTHRALNYLVHKEKVNSLPKVLALFGAGPCPEIIGYLDFVNHYMLSMRGDVHADIFDINMDTWGHSHQITFNYLAPDYYGEVSLNQWIPRKFDLTKESFSFNDNQPRIIIFQNCLNEIKAGNHGAVVNNIVEMCNSLSASSYILIIDLSEYSTANNLISEIEKAVAESDGELIRGISEGNLKFRSPFPPNEFIRKHLLTGIPYELANGLIPRSTINYNFSIIKKA